MNWTVGEEGKFELKRKSKFGFLVLSPLSSPLQDWSKFTQIFSKMVGENVDSKQLGVAPTTPTQNRRTDEYDDQYTDYYNYWVIYNDTTITRWKYTSKYGLTLKTWFMI